MPGRLANKILVIIGGTTGLGLSAAKTFIREQAKGVIVGRNPDNVAAAQRILAGASQAFTADATSPQTAVKAIHTAIETFGGFHGLYHVAGGSGRKFGDGPLHEITDAGWDQTLTLNLTSL